MDNESEESAMRIFAIRPKPFELEKDDLSGARGAWNGSVFGAALWLAIIAGIVICKGC